MEVIPSTNNNNESIGDIYYGYFIPTVICGRTLSFESDLNNFITNCTVNTYNNKAKEDCNDLGLENLGLEFKRCMLSKLLVISPRENLSDVWQILWGVWSKLLHKGPSDNQETDYILIYKANCIFVMFYLYHCQSGNNNLAIPLSIETLNVCLSVGKGVLDRYTVTSVVDVLDFMLNNNCISVTLFDGIQYIYQNKYGKVLRPKLD